MVETAKSQPAWGPGNPHPLSRMKTELVWDGKYDEYGSRRPVTLPTSPLPLQRIETIDEPRDRIKASQPRLFNEASFAEKAHRDDFRNLLIWGDNKLAMASLLEQFRGKVHLICIDPPFAVGADFTMRVQLGEEDEALLKEHSVLEEVVYRDMWGKGTDSYLHMMYERMLVMRDLLTDDGSIVVHCDWHVGHYLKIVADEVFGKGVDGEPGFRNEIAWCYRTGGAPGKGPEFPKKHDMLLYYSKGKSPRFNKLKERIYYERPFFTSLKDEQGRWYADVLLRDVLQDELKIVGDDGSLTAVNVKPVINVSAETLGFLTQKPEGLLRVILTAFTREGDLVADFFCGSGTTLAVAEKLGRRWIGVDLGRYAIHTTRKRLIQVQRDLHAAGQPYRPFDVYNLGRYERQWWQLERLKGADVEHRRTVLRFYKSAPLPNPPSPLLHGKKEGAYVHVDEIDGIFTYEELRAVAEAAQTAGARELHCLAWEFEMELPLRKREMETASHLDIRLKYIPREIMEPNRTECQFFEAGYLEAKAVRSGKKVDVELVRFNPALAEAPEAEMAALRERAVKSPFDFIDFWAVDFDWRDGRPFEHHWQDFRTRKDRSLKTRSDKGYEYQTPGKHQICVKVIDVFGVDTTAVITVEV